MTDTLTHTAVAAVVTGQRDSLIRAEVLAMDERAALEQAVVQAVQMYGISVDMISEASGLRPEEITALLSR